MYKGNLCFPNTSFFFPQVRRSTNLPVQVKQFAIAIAISERDRDGITTLISAGPSSYNDLAFDWMRVS